MSVTELYAAKKLHNIDHEKPVTYLEWDGIQNVEKKAMLSPSGKEGLKKLRAFLQDDAKQVTPVFTLQAGEEGKPATLLLHSLETGPGATDIDALNRLDELLKGTGQEKQGNMVGSHGFDPNQTAAILSKMPAVGQGQAK